MLGSEGGGDEDAAVEALCERGMNGVYPVADDEMLSTNRLIELIAEACGKRARLWRLPKSLMRAAATGIITAIFSIALGRRKCYYSIRFKESDSWDML